MFWISASPRSTFCSSSIYLCCFLHFLFSNLSLPVFFYAHCCSANGPLGLATYSMQHPLSFSLRVYPKPLKELNTITQQDQVLSFEIILYFTKHHCEEAQLTMRNNKTRNKRGMMCGNNFHLKNKTFIKKRNKNRQTRYLIVTIFYTHNSSGDFRLTWTRETAQLPV